MSKPGNPPAFPSRCEDDFEGMTMRDYLVAAVLPPLVAEALRLDHKSWDATVEHAFIIADKVLKERAK